MLEMMGKLAFDTNVINWETVQLFMLRPSSATEILCCPYLKNNVGRRSSYVIGSRKSFVALVTKQRDIVRHRYVRKES